MEKFIAERGREVVVGGEAGSSLRELLRSVRGLLVPRALPPAEIAAPTSRELAVGETVYHRKVGNGRHYDIFDAGSHEPCKHGATGYRTFGGDKARKGMARRYRNFADPDVQLLHCDRYPNCGMYAVHRRDRRTSG